MFTRSLVTLRVKVVELVEEDAASVISPQEEATTTTLLVKSRRGRPSSRVVVGCVDVLFIFIDC